MELNSKQGIYEVKDGVISSSATSQAEYDKAKVITANQYTDKEGGSLPYIPGVQQFHVLIEESGGAFKVTEVHCDGDCIYPW